MCTVMDILTISSMPPIFVTDFLSEPQFKQESLRVSGKYIYAKMEARKETEKVDNEGCL